MVKMKPLTTITQNYTSSAARAGTGYKQGVQGADWATPTSSKATDDKWQGGVARAIANGTRIKGVQEAGNQKWLNGANTKGSANIVTGITNAGPAQSAGYTPIYNALSALQLPAKAGDYRTNINARLIPVVEAEINASPKKRGM